MLKTIRTSRITKGVVYYLCLMMILEIAQPMSMYALTSGPTQPEFNAFTPIDTSDMVNLSSGDFNYNIPIMDVGGYPLNLAYNSGVTMDQEASWVGLGWNLNVGQISRQVRGLPDDFRGDKIVYDNNLRDNFTIGSNFNLSPAVFGFDSPFKFGLGAQYNNYEGISFSPSIGLSFAIAKNTEVGFDLSASTSQGATISPSVKISSITKDKDGSSLSLGGSYSSRKGLENMSMSVVNKRTSFITNDKTQSSYIKESTNSASGSISFNNTNNYTPSKRIGYINTNQTFNATIGGTVFGVDGQVRINGYGSYQSVDPKYKHFSLGGYGYDNTEYKKNNEGVLDFNRDNEQTISKNTNVLATTNYTYDIYSIEGQGVSGMFRPNRSQVGYVYNDEVSDFAIGGSFGAELDLGNLVHGGGNFVQSPTFSSTGRWSNKNNAIPYFTEEEKKNGNPLYQASSFKIVGELNVDDDDDYLNKINNTTAQKLKIEGGKFNRTLSNNYLSKPNYGSSKINNKIQRNKRLLSNQVVQKITNDEADNLFVEKRDNKPGHHNVGMKVIQSDGSTYVFGKAAYNTKKVEATFDVSGRGQEGTDIQDGLISYSSNMSLNTSSISDQYVNKITTPEYVHTFLISSILSSDYKDINNNGPDDKDLGTYTKFDYTDLSNYNWRTPYGLNKATYNEGLKVSKKDQKGNYIYGEKELRYLNRIETKSHIAFIDLEDREDAVSTNGEHGGGSNSNSNTKMKYIKSIRLYSKSEILHNVAQNFIAATLNQYQDDYASILSVKPIKTAHFEYNYKLCQGTPNNFGELTGKLTLEKLYFTYRDSKMGKYTPYKFFYGDESLNSLNYNITNDPINNPAYKMKGNDIWGNYKPIPSSGPSPDDYPFVEQDKTTADQYTKAWVLKSIQLPSGGTIKITTESDDYKYVQNKKAMQMFKVVGAGTENVATEDLSNTLYDHLSDRNFLYVKIGDTNPKPTNSTLSDSDYFIDKYLSENFEKAIYFKFLLKMTRSDHFEYVKGYFEIDKAKKEQININDQGVVSIPVKMLKREENGNGQYVNPISKAGWGFGRTYLNRVVNSNDGEETVKTGFVPIVNELVSSIDAMREIFTGPNGFLRGKGCADKFDASKSWIRLENPNGKKLGGGLRVKKIELSDNWDVMNSVEGNEIYNEMYGQEYQYTLGDNSESESSGVATFEPNASPENPFVEPFYGNDGNYADRISAPKELNYSEKPFGASFFPGAKVTYSRVSVKNLDRIRPNNNIVVKKHATGRVVSEFYTTRDFPTKVDYTTLDIYPDEGRNPLFFMLKIYSSSHLTASQGFSIVTNDMDGKQKSQSVYPENQNNPISKVVYKYNIDSNGDLDNNLLTVNNNGVKETSELGVTYDVINDFNESNSQTFTLGINGNLATFLVGIFPGIVPTAFPEIAYQERILRTATTTKVIHKTGILVETIASDLGSKVSTKNLAWDAKSGQVILTQTVNEFDDNYYSFTYPAYWGYENMGMASENLDLSSKLVKQGNYFKISETPTNSSITPYLKIGDELLVKTSLGVKKLWVVAYNNTKISVRLMDKDGNLITDIDVDNTFKVVKSGYRNQQMASMASVTSMLNPLNAGNITKNTFYYQGGKNYDGQTTPNPKIVNASAIEYSDDWLSQCENGLPNEAGLIMYGTPTTIPVNPYLYNTKGNWRPVKSYAYLGGRNNFENDNIRKTGFFEDFMPFYILNFPAVNKWNKHDARWTYASSVTKYSPYGVELENADALKRYSSAQYGYNYKLPVAVASNAEYREMGFDSFEDYVLGTVRPHFAFTENMNAENGKITQNHSHTGNNSIEVRAKKKVALTRKIGGCKPPIEILEVLDGNTAKTNRIKKTKK